MSAEVPIDEDPKLLVIGCGGIGGVIAATLLEQGHAVTCVARPDIAEALTLRGLELRDDAGTRLVRGRLTVHEQVPVSGVWDYILLAVQPNQVEEAARLSAPLLGDRGVVVCFQNGLCEERVVPILGRDRVVGGVIAWGASSPFPGVYERTSAGGFTLGTLAGGPDDRVGGLQRVLEGVGAVELTGNLAGVRWSKLALNCAISSLGTIGGDRLGSLLVQRFVRRLALEVMTEVVAVAQAEGIRLEKVAGTLDLEWVALTESERAADLGSPSLFAKHSLLLAVGARYRRLRSSMLAAIERGKEPPVDFLNGEVVERAARHGLKVPVNQRILETVKALARHQGKSGMPALRQLFEETRPR